MQHPSLETIAERLTAQLRCEQEDLCRPILQQVTRGKPVTPASLQASLQVSQDELEQRLARLSPDVEFDQAGNIVGLGATQVPTSHRLQIGGRLLYTWCAFDTLTYPVELHLSAQVTSRCPVTGSSIQLTVTPEQVLDLDPGEAQVSLVVDVADGCCSNVRQDVCNYGHFFASREAALLWQAAHREAVILSVEEAYRVGKLGEGSHFRDAEP